MASRYECQNGSCDNSVVIGHESVRHPTVCPYCNREMVYDCSVEMEYVGHKDQFAPDEHRIASND